VALPEPGVDILMDRVGGFQKEIKVEKKKEQK
jgi:hypothetical protein